jgi:hypothetical protein
MVRVSNGRERRPDREEIQIHRRVRALHKELVPARLNLQLAKHRLMAATGNSFGIEGIVRVKFVPATIRFSPAVAAKKFPEHLGRCQSEVPRGPFRWRKIVKPFHFVAENLAAKDAIALAKIAAHAVLAANGDLQGWTTRTSELEHIHDEFLSTTQTVTRLQAEIAELQTDMTLRLDDYDAVDPICSFRRREVMWFDAAAFCRLYPDEAIQCAEPVATRLRKHVYRTRSY